MALAAASQTISGDLYYSTDTQEVFIAATDGSVAPVAGILMQGGITGQPGLAGATGPQGPQGPVGPAGSGTSSVAFENGDYTTLSTDDTMLCGGSVVQNITLLTDGIPVGKVYTVTLLVTANKANIVSQHGELIMGESSALLYEGDSADFLWDGTGWVIQ
jgi:hypothetical protein